MTPLNPTEMKLGNYYYVPTVENYENVKDIDLCTFLYKSAELSTDFIRPTYIMLRHSDKQHLVIDNSITVYLR